MLRRSEYFDLVRAHPELFANPPGAAFEILLTDDQIGRAERTMEERLVAGGGAPDWAQVGIAFRDQYLMVVRDAVRFLDGSLGTYIRLWNPHPARLGVAILPVCRGQVLLVRHFRHATRSWQIEIPRGAGIYEDAAETARQELREEIGAEASVLTELGLVNPDAGASASPVALFLARVESYGSGEVVEGITEVLPTSVEDFEQMIGSGELTDGYLLATFARARARRLI